MPNDPGFSSQAALNNSTDRDIDAPQAWNITTGSSGVVVAVLDTGIDYNHPDLAGRVDTAHDFDFVNNDSDAQDDNGHGTFVAGIIGAAGNNGVGVTGVAWNSTLLPVKVVDASGVLTTAQEVSGINYVVSQKQTAGVNVRVINASFGFYYNGSRAGVRVHRHYEREERRYSVRRRGREREREQRRLESQLPGIGHPGQRHLGGRERRERQPRFLLELRGHVRRSGGPWGFGPEHRVQRESDHRRADLWVRDGERHVLLGPDGLRRRGPGGECGPEPDVLADPGRDSLRGR